MPSSTLRAVLGVEGGGTKTEWHLGLWEGDRCVEKIAGGYLPAANLKLSDDRRLEHLFGVLPRPAQAVGVFLAGCATEEDRRRLESLVRAAWPEAERTVGSDRDSALAASFGGEDGIVVIAGTGAAIHGRRAGRVERAGGWGQLLGDRGSGYHLAMQALRQVLCHYDLTGEVSPLAQTILRLLALNRLRDLVDWVSQAEKMAVARLAPAVFESARAGQEAAARIVREGAEILADEVRAVAGRLGDLALPVKLFGGLFVHHQEYADQVCAHLGRTAEVGRESGALGAAWLAVRGKGAAPAAPAAEPNAPHLAGAATEQANPRSAGLEKMATPELVALFVREERAVEEALAGAKEAIVRAVDRVTEAMRQGGRLFYAGAGTSGRLGVLDASEIPPTFGASPEWVQAIMAGGATALYRAVEGAEDQPEAGAFAVRHRGVAAGDIVCGLAASGRTPFVLGALRQARAVGAGTLLLTCNPARPRAAGEEWDVEIDLATGPEIVTGSTRLKAGTATKLVLNILSTCAMIRLGRVRGNAMVDLQISNAKLRDRGARLVSETLGVPYAEAWSRLEKAEWKVRAVLEDEAAPPAARG